MSSSSLNQATSGTQSVDAGNAPILPNGEVFDEAYYLQNNPDVADAVAKGVVQSGFEHWIAHGRSEGRFPGLLYNETDRVNVSWYLQVYPAALMDIDSGRARDAEHHYQTLGRFRGYLPNSYANRPPHPTATPSQFGGLWVDHANAADLIEGKRQIGRMTARQAMQLQSWAQNGYLILPQALPRKVVDRAAGELHRAYAGDFPQLRFECPSLGGYAPMPWQPGVRDKPAKALDLHWWSQAIRDLIFADPVREMLELLFERRVMASQSLTFLRGSAQGYHQDTLYVPFSLPTQFVASWIALEDVTPGGGELTYFPGSHKLPEHLYGERYKTLWDARRELRRNSVYEEMQGYSGQLEQRCRDMGLSPASFMARKGDVLLWHADLVHGGLPISSQATRASVVTHYTASEVAALPCERGRSEQRAYKGVAQYGTQYYATAS
jgi:hypothetical protein